MSSTPSELHDDHYRYFDAVGRPRKLPLGAMKSIQRKFEEGIPTRTIAEQYGVSTNMILTICYFTPKGSPLRPEQPDQKQPDYSANGATTEEQN